MATNLDSNVITNSSSVIGGIGLSNPFGVSVPSTQSTVRSFDISESALQAAAAKGNKRQDVLSAYETYLSGAPVGKGGQYAVSAQQKYGFASIRDAAASYLQAAGLTFLPEATAPPSVTTDTNTTTQTNTTQEKNPFELLVDILPNLFGQSVSNPPLQTQTYGYTPETTIGGTGGFDVKPWLIIAAVVVIGYFLYKRYVK
jgi:hypothetical protein